MSEPYVVSYDKTFSQLGNIKTHVLSHTGEKKHKCKACDKTFTHSGDLNKHVFIHTGEKTNTL